MQALQRILSILDAIGRSPEGLPAARVADETGLSLSTVARLMQSLQDEDVLFRSKTTGQYRIGPRLIGIVSSATRSFDVRAAASPILEKLRDASGGETASLHVRQGAQRVCVAVAYTSHSTGRIVPLGLPLPLPGSAVGHALLAQMDDTELDALIATLGLSTSAEKDLLERVAQVRDDGFALSVNDSVEGVRGLAVPLNAARGGGALSVSGPSDRLTQEQVPALLERLREAATVFEQSGLNLTNLTGLHTS